jgi:hypothetical protein
MARRTKRATRGAVYDKALTEARIVHHYKLGRALE